MENKIRKLNLGCGPKWKEQYPDYLGLDIMDYGQEFVGDVLEYLESVSNLPQEEKFEEVMANHFLEHFSQDELKKIFTGVHAILQDGGIFRFTVPHMKKEKSWVLSHKTFWNKTMIEWMGDEDAGVVYGLGFWDVKEVIVNEREDIHAIFIKRNRKQEAPVVN